MSGGIVADVSLQLESATGVPASVGRRESAHHLTIALSPHIINIIGVFSMSKRISRVQREHVATVRIDSGILRIGDPRRTEEEDLHVTGCCIEVPKEQYQVVLYKGAGVHRSPMGFSIERVGWRSRSGDYQQRVGTLTMDTGTFIIRDEDTELWGLIVHTTQYGREFPVVGFYTVSNQLVSLEVQFEQVINDPQSSLNGVQK